jgi:Na+/phosphate symporter
LDLFVLLTAQLVFGFVKNVTNTIKKYVARKDHYEAIRLISQQHGSSSDRSDIITSDSALHNNDLNYEEDEDHEELMDLIINIL